MAALTSAVPTLYSHRVLLGVGMVALIGVANLRGLRESGRIFAAWSYLFIAGYLALIGYGLVSYLFGGPGAPHPPACRWKSRWARSGIFLLLRAFASGAVALTGIEAVSDGVTAFKPPEVRNAQKVLVVLGVIMVALFVGIHRPRRPLPDCPRDEETVISQLSRQVFGAASSTTSSRPSRWSSSCSPPIPPSPTFPGSRTSWPATATCRASSSVGAIGSSTRTA